VQQSIGKLNRLNVTLYSIDTRGNQTEKEYQDSLIQIASEQAACPSTIPDNFTVGLQRVQNDVRHQYLLCYSPPEHKSPRQVLHHQGQRPEKRRDRASSRRILGIGIYDLRSEI